MSMTLKNTQTEYGRLARFFHWFLALLLIGLLAMGLTMDEFENGPIKFQIFMLHKSFGTLVFMLAVLRVLWRFSNRKPDHLPSHKPWEIKLAGVTHVLLYMFMFAIPLSGYLMNAAKAYPHPFFGLFNVPPVLGKDEAIAEFFEEVHELAAYGLMVILALHVIGALKHMIIDKDETMKRMRPDRPLVFLGGMIAIIIALGYMGIVNTGSGASPAPQAKESRYVDYDDDEHDDGYGDYDDESEHVEGRAKADTSGVPVWVIDKEESALGFSATVEGAAFAGEFEEFGGDIHFDPDNLDQSYVEIHVDLASVESGSEERDEYMVSTDWFDTESFPESVFKAEKFKKIKEDQYIAQGVLTIKGVTLPVDLPFTLDIETDDKGNKIAKMNGALTIRRLDYNLGAGQWSNIDTVANEVSVNVSVETRQK